MLISALDKIGPKEIDKMKKCFWPVQRANFLSTGSLIQNFTGLTSIYRKMISSASHPHLGMLPLLKGKTADELSA